MDRRSLLKELICAPMIGKLLSRAVISESRIEGPESWYEGKVNRKGAKWLGFLYSCERIKGYDYSMIAQNCGITEQRLVEDFRKFKIDEDHPEVRNGTALIMWETIYRIHTGKYPDSDCPIPVTPLYLSIPYPLFVADLSQHLHRLFRPGWYNQYQEVDRVNRSHS